VEVGILAFIVLLLDGFDIVAIGFIIPSLIDAWHVTRQALGPTLVAALIGLAIGAMAGGPIADRIGRRKVIIGSILFFGIMSFASAFSTGLTMLTILRFLTGLGLGASQPNTGTLISEYAPYRHRSIFVTLTYCGFTVGAALGGFLSAALLATYGWPSILIVGGVVPMFIALLCVFLLPESPRFLTLHPSRHTALVKIAPGTANPNTEFVSNEVVTGKVPFAQIVSRPYVTTTLLLWMGIFSTMFTVYLS
jgi:AAHS family 4-hydroxybenzoate transporter-like MFS transporter